MGFISWDGISVGIDKAMSEASPAIIKSQAASLKASITKNYILIGLVVALGVILLIKGRGK